MKTFYIDKETKKQLEYLCKKVNLTEKEMIKACIDGTYNSIYNLKENPKELFIDVVEGLVKFTNELKQELSKNKEKKQWKY